MARKLSKWVEIENTEGNTVFSKDIYCRHVKTRAFGKEFNIIFMNVVHNLHGHFPTSLLQVYQEVMVVVILVIQSSL